MGQYYYVVNLDKKQYLHPHRFGDGLKLLEFGCSGSGTMLGLAVLLADGNGRGGGDLDSEDPIVGSWAGDRIVIAGDYADNERFTQGLANPDGTVSGNLYSIASESFEDISYAVVRAMAADKYVAHDLREAKEIGTGMSVYDSAMANRPR